MAEQVKELVGTETATATMSPMPSMKVEEHGFFSLHNSHFLWLLVAVVVLLLLWWWWRQKKARRAHMPGQMPGQIPSDAQKQMDMQQQMQMYQMEQQDMPPQGIGYMPETNYYPKTYNGWGTY